MLPMLPKNGALQIPSRSPVPVTVATVALCASGYGATCFKDVSEAIQASLDARGVALNQGSLPKTASSSLLQPPQAHSEAESHGLPPALTQDSSGLLSRASSVEEGSAGIASWNSLMQGDFQSHKKKAVLAAKNAKLNTVQSQSFETEDEVQPRFSIHEKRAACSLVCMVESAWFTYSIQATILVNLIILGVEVDTAARLAPGEEPQGFWVANVVIVLIFMVELLLKLIVQGVRQFFCGPERWWNLFDMLIVGLSLLETLIEILASMMAVSQMDSSHLRVMRFARLARALRGVRVIKLLRYIGALRTIIFSIISTMSSLLWTLVLLAILWYCFGVVITQIVTDDCRYPKEDGSVSCDALLVKFWSSIGESILTLFMAITGGLSWGEALDPLFEVSYLAVASMILYVVFAVFAVLNVVTGVFCNQAIESARADKDIAIMKQMHKHEQQVQLLREIFSEIDQDESNLISIKELKNAMEGKKMASFMHSMDISTQDIWTLFMVIDADGSGEISLEEFVFGCMQLQGPAKGLQIARMSYENTIMREERWVEYRIKD
ncbi:Cacna1s [Symbiodinium natans]|uniref:Cacna1s protein n=1 Tax=Symbiodinium natans TaxID=878477 RepID=A0A812PQE3_9DINO|nr:Cacna1s [Symbiodinium natans]